MRLIIAFSGPIAVGKSVSINELVKRCGASRISTRELIQSKRDVPTERGPLQVAGDELDAETDGKWVADGLAAQTDALDNDAIVIVDSVRIPRQVEQLKAKYEERVVHVHLTASQEELKNRFKKRKDEGDPAVREFETYEEAQANSTEAQIEELKEIADLVIPTDDLDAESIAMRITERFEI